MAKKNRVPKYGLHKASKQATFRWARNDLRYLGKHGSKASREAYSQLLAEWLARDGEPVKISAEGLTIIELANRFRKHALKHYRKDGKTTGEVDSFYQALKPLLALYGTKKDLVRDFGPLKLKAVRAAMVKGFIDRHGNAVAGVSRGVVNNRVRRLKHIFRWAVSEELAPASVAQALNAVAGLQAGRTDARETEPVGPADDLHVEATLPYLPQVVADMVRVQRLTGARPGEICDMRPKDINRTCDPWEYRPQSHKTSHRGNNRIIRIGPRAQKILRRYLLTDASDPLLRQLVAESTETNGAAIPFPLRAADDFCFVPAESERKRRAEQRATRKSKVPPSQLDRSKRRPKRKAGTYYDRHSYTRAVARACDRADVPRWTPNQLRHRAATVIRRRFGLEAAQVCLGHSAADVTQVYAERDQALAGQVMKEIG